MKVGEYSVCQFFVDGQHEYVRRWVTVEEAMRAFIFYTNNVAAKLGIVVERVIITDGGDCINMEWKAGKGITFPPEAAGRALRPDWEQRLAINDMMEKSDD